MTRYERRFQTDWETIDGDEAARHAYAIGVGERLGDDDRDHLERIYEAMATAYEQSMVELAYNEGRREAADAAADRDSKGAIWRSLVEDDPVEIDASRLPTGGRSGLPAALGPSEVLTEVDIDSRQVLDRPEFLDR